MKTKRIHKGIVVFALLFSVFCSVYLGWQSCTGVTASIEEANYVTSNQSSIAFPEVEVIKVFVEKVIDMVTTVTV